MNSIEVQLTPTTMVLATPNQVSSDFLDGEVVILGLKDGIYYGLNPVGARIWELIQSPKIVAEVRDALLQEYDIDADTCLRELQALLSKLADRGLIEVHGPAG